MRPEFLLLTLLAYGSLLFSHKKIAYFALLGIFGAFLAKGSNPPFGQVYLLLFDFFPGFSVFRDPTKFYVLIALSFSVLIPYTLSKLSTLVIKKMPLRYIAYGAFFIVFIFTTRESITQQLAGTFKPHEVPKEYIELKNFLQEIEGFDVLWVPQRQRFGFTSQEYRAIAATDFFNLHDVEDIVSNIKDKPKETFVQNISARYIIVPYDSQQELFLTDRKYDEQKYTDTVGALQELPWLVQRANFGKIIVFEVQ